MLVAAAVCPHPPAIVPALAAGAASELDEVRAACDRAVQALLAAAPDVLVVVGADVATRRHPAGARGSLRGYGEPLDVGPLAPTAQGPADGDRDSERASLPLSLTIGSWLLERARTAGTALPPVEQQGVATDESPVGCAALGRALADEAPRVALLAMGDGSARRHPKAPGAEDPRAVPWDDGVLGALEEGDVAALAALDPALATELWAAGRAAWQVLAGAWGATHPDAELLLAADPYGVSYAVALWTRPG